MKRWGEIGMTRSYLFEFSSALTAHYNLGPVHAFSGHWQFSKNGGPEKGKWQCCCRKRRLKPNPCSRSSGGNHIYTWTRVISATIQTVLLDTLSKKNVRRDTLFNLQTKLRLLVVKWRCFFTRVLRGLKFFLIIRMKVVSAHSTLLCGAGKSLLLFYGEGHLHTSLACRRICTE